MSYSVEQQEDTVQTGADRKIMFFFLGRDSKQLSYVDPSRIFGLRL